MVTRTDSSAVASDILQMEEFNAAVTTLPSSTVRAVAATCRFQDRDSDALDADYLCLVTVFDTRVHKQRTFKDTVSCDAVSSAHAVSSCSAGASDSEETEQRLPGGKTTSTALSGSAATPTSAPSASASSQRAEMLSGRLGRAGYQVSTVNHAAATAAVPGVPGSATAAHSMFTATKGAYTIEVYLFGSAQSAANVAATVAGSAAAHSGSRPYKLVGSDFFAECHACGGSGTSASASQSSVDQAAAVSEGS
jgi:hypothetical protein